MTTKRKGRPAVYPFHKLEEGIGKSVHVAIVDLTTFAKVRSAAHVFAFNRGWKVTTVLQGEDAPYIKVLRVA